MARVTTECAGVPTARASCLPGRMRAYRSWAVNRRPVFWRRSGVKISRLAAANGQRLTRRNSSNRCVTSSNAKVTLITRRLGFGMTELSRHRRRVGCWLLRFRQRSTHLYRRRNSACSECSHCASATGIQIRQIPILHLQNLNSPTRGDSDSATPRGAYKH